MKQKNEVLKHLAFTAALTCGTLALTNTVILAKEDPEAIPPVHEEGPGIQTAEPVEETPAAEETELPEESAEPETEETELPEETGEEPASDPEEKETPVIAEEETEPEKEAEEPAEKEETAVPIRRAPAKVRKAPKLEAVNSLDLTGSKVTDLEYDLPAAERNTESEEPLIQRTPVTTGLQKSLDGNLYYYTDTAGSRLTNQEKYVNGHWYYFGDTGAAAKGITWIGYKTVCYNDAGQMLYGLQKVDGTPHYFDPVTGEMDAGRERFSDGWYYFNEDGSAAKGFVHLGDRILYYGDDYKMRYGSQEIDGKMYVFDCHFGNLLRGTGEHFVNDHWFYVNPDNSVSTGLTDIGPKTVYYNEKGEMLYGRQEIGDQIYFLDDHYGELEYVVDASVENKTEKQENGNWYLVNEDGEKYTGLQRLSDGRTCYYADDGRMLKGDQLIGERRFWLDERTGSIVTNSFKWNARGLSYYGRYGAAVHDTEFEKNGADYKVDHNGRVYSTIVPMGYYNQGSPAWAYYRVGSGNIGATGCAPTNAATIANHFGVGGNPIDYANLFRSWGNMNTWVAGTDNSVWSKFAGYCGLQYANGLSYEQMVRLLQEGWVVEACVGPGNYCPAGATHSLILTGLDSEGRTFIEDPLNSYNNGWYSPLIVWNQQSHASEDVMAGGPFAAFIRR
jgi:glucan-binding YG repeat protein